MNGVAASLVAFAAAYALAGAYWTLLGRARPRLSGHYGLAAFSAALAGYAVASAYVWGARSPAESASAQTVAIGWFMGALALFTEHSLRVLGLPLGAARLQRGLAGVGICVAATGLFYDPAIADASVQLGRSTRAIAAIRPIGLLVLVPMAGVATYATLAVFRAARRRTELVLPAVLILAAAVSAVVDLVNRSLEIHADWQLSAHGAALALVGFMYLAVGRITQIEVELQDREEALAQSQGAMRSTQAELVRKEQLAAVGELSAVIAHEVRNPLAIIKNAAGGLRRDALKPADADTLLSILDEETDRLDRLIDDLLAYARPISVDRQRVDVRSLVVHAVELAASGNPDIAKFEIELDLDTEVEPVDGDEALLRHALINIVDNALQAMPDGGMLTASVRDAVVDGTPGVVAVINDTGEGMDTKVRTRARDPFFTTRQSGTGLGLAIVERVARAHSGRVDLESRHGRGTSVRLFVPKEQPVS